MSAVKGQAPTKECPGCHNRVHCRVRTCACGTEFSFKDKATTKPSPASVRRLNKIGKTEPVQEPEGMAALPKTPELTGESGGQVVELIVPCGPLPRALSPPKEEVERWVKAIRAHYLAKGRLLTYVAAIYVLKTELGYILGELARDNPSLFQGTTQ